MDTASQILLIIVSSVLAIFLIVAITLLVLIIKLVKQFKLMIERAEKAVDTVTEAGEMLRNASGPIAMIKVIRSLVKHYRK